MNDYWKDLISSFYAPESWLKVVIMLGLLPFWWPTVKMMLREFLDSLNMEKERKLAHGEDPCLSVPLASHRRTMPGGGGGRRGSSGGEITPRPRTSGSGGGSSSTRSGGTRRGFAPNRR